MFCPNCGTQNPETALVCSKCNFNLKGAAAPKFKGTMLMMNQQGAATPAPPGAAAPAPTPPPTAPMTGGPSSAGAPRPAATNKLKGTMVGVAPPVMPVAGKPGSAPAPAPAAFGAPAPAQNYAPPAPPPQYAPPPAPPMDVAPPPQYAPPPQQYGGGQPVNPLGGTMAADAGSFQQYAPPQAQQGYGSAPPGGYAPPPAPPPQYGAPPPPDGGGQYGAPPAYGAPPPAYGAPPPAYGGPPQGGYGGPPPQQQGFGSNPPGQQQTYGQPGAPMQAAYGQPPDQGGIMAQASAGMMAASQGGTKPTTRNALMTMLMPVGCWFGGIVISILFGIIAGVAGVAAIGMIGGLISLLAMLAGAYFLLMPLIKMVGEIKSVTNNQSFAWWPIFVPIYGIYWMVLMLPAEVANAKRAVGAPEPVRSPVLYFFVGLYALASDVNDIAARAR